MKKPESIISMDIPEELLRVSSSIEESASVIKKFEQTCADLFDARYAFAVNSCSSGLLLAMLAVGVRSGDEVIVPGLTWPGSWFPSAMLGAILVPVDCSPYFPVMDPELLESKINNKTRVIMAVGLWGYAAGLYEIQQIAKAHNIPVILDAAQLALCKTGEKGVGQLADVAIVSCNATKPLLATGEGGIILCNSNSICDRLSVLTQQPTRIAYEINNLHYMKYNLGYSLNLRMNSITALLGLQRIYIDACIGATEQRSKHMTEMRSKLGCFGLEEVLPPSNWVNAEFNATKLLTISTNTILKHPVTASKGLDHFDIHTSRCPYNPIHELIGKYHKGIFRFIAPLRVKYNSQEGFSESVKWKDKLLIVN